jgi:VIT1/CCC1 family predicted Fe2+/Mn2+ transporter
MLETLDPSEKTVARRWGLLLSYGTFVIGGFLFLILDVRRHRFSHPFELVVAAALLLLSLTWFLTTLASRSTITTRKFAIRNMILVVLLTVHDIAFR